MSLKIFQAISGLKVNLLKTCMVGIHVEEEELVTMVGIMGCQTGRWALQYLGMPLGGNPKSVSFWDLVVEKVAKKLTVWKLYIPWGKNYVG